MPRKWKISWNGYPGIIKTKEPLKDLSLVELRWGDKVIPMRVQDSQLCLRYSNVARLIRDEHNENQYHVSFLAIKSIPEKPEERIFGTLYAEDGTILSENILIGFYVQFTKPIAPE